MKIQTFEDLFHHDLKDLYDAEHQLLDALETMAEKASSQDLKRAFKSHRKETEVQIQRLEKVFEEFGKKPQRKKCEAIKGLIEEAEELIEDVQTSEVLDAALCAAAQKVEHYEMAGYGAARTYAGMLGLEQAAQLLQETLDEEGEANKKLMTAAEKLNKKAERKSA